MATSWPARVSGKRDDAALSSAVVAENELPTMLNRFVGRERELAELLELIGHARLLTLTGPGGVGKTRLAVCLAAHVQPRFEHRVVFVDLGLASPAEPISQLVGGSRKRIAP